MSCTMPGTTVDMDSCGTLRKLLEVCHVHRFSFLTVKADSDPEILVLLSRTLC